MQPASFRRPKFSTARASRLAAPIARLALLAGHFECAPACAFRSACRCALINTTTSSQLVAVAATRAKWLVANDLYATHRIANVTLAAGEVLVLFIQREPTLLLMVKVLLLPSAFVVAALAIAAPTNPELAEVWILVATGALRTGHLIDTGLDWPIVAIAAGDRGVRSSQLNAGPEFVIKRGDDLLERSGVVATRTTNLTVHRCRSTTAIELALVHVLMATTAHPRRADELPHACLHFLVAGMARDGIVRAGQRVARRVRRDTKAVRQEAFRVMALGALLHHAGGDKLALVHVLVATAAVRRHAPREPGLARRTFVALAAGEIRVRHSQRKASGTMLLSTHGADREVLVLIPVATSTTAFGPDLRGRGANQLFGMRTGVAHGTRFYRGCVALPHRLGLRRTVTGRALGLGVQTAQREAELGVLGQGRLGTWPAIRRMATRAIVSLGEQQRRLD